MIVESTISRVDIRARLKPIAKRIRLSEQKIMPPECRESVEIFGKPIFPLPGTGEAWYGPTPMLALIEYLDFPPSLRCQWFLTPQVRVIYRLLVVTV